MKQDTSDDIGTTPGLSVATEPTDPRFDRSDEIDADRSRQPDAVVSAAPPLDDRRPLTPSLLKRRLAMADSLAIGLGVTVAFVLQATLEPARSTSVSWQLALSVPAVAVMLVTAAMVNLYTARATRRASEEFRHILVSTFFGVASIVFFSFVLTFGSLSRFWVGWVFVSVAVLWAIERRIARSVFHRLRCSGRLTRRTVIIGADAGAARLARTLAKRPDLGYTPMGFVGEGHASLLTGHPKLGQLDDIHHIVADAQASGVIISMSAVDHHEVNDLARTLTDAGIHVTLSTALEDIHIGRLRTYDIDGRAMIYIEPTIRTGWRRHAKRAFDLTGAFFGLLLSAPLLLAAMIAIRLESKGPILFRQNRVGLDGEVFRIFKLRTMVVDAEAIQANLAEQNESDGPLFKIRRDPRITRVGRLLRKTSIDELPQFWNVIRGEMSFVGPRPALPTEVEQWEGKVHERLRVLPGITGRWQVSGRASTTFEEYTRLDLHYVDNWSLMQDLRIVLKTVVVVLRGSGAS